MSGESVTSSYLIVDGREGEVLVSLLLLEESGLIDHISSSRRGRVGMGPCTVAGVSTGSGISNSGVSKKGSPGGEGRLAVSVGENDSGGDLSGVSSEESLSGSVQCIAQKGKQRCKMLLTAKTLRRPCTDDSVLFRHHMSDCHTFYVLALHGVEVPVPLLLGVLVRICALPRFD